MIYPRFNMSVFSPQPDARHVMLDLFESKQTSLLVPDDDPRVEISDNTEYGAWQTELR